MTKYLKNNLKEIILAQFKKGCNACRQEREAAGYNVPIRNQSVMNAGAQLVSHFIGP